jgi:hypothetical protein
VERVDGQVAGRGYLDHLTDEDLRLLAAAAGLDVGRAGELRRHPATVVDLAGHPGLFERVYRPDRAGLVGVSPFLAFLVAVQQAEREIATTRFVVERSGARQRVPVFDTPRLREFLTDPMRRLFLAELLASFVRVASGRYWVKTARGWRSQRYSDLDPVRLARLAEQTPATHRAGVYRRLGDVSLFLTGMFPDYVQAHAFGPVDAARLIRAAGLDPRDDLDSVAAAPIRLLETLGQRWYRQAGQHASVATRQLTVVSEIADRFRDARRVLNHIADRHLARVGNPWFAPPGS